MDASRRELLGQCTTAALSPAAVPPTLADTSWSAPSDAAGRASEWETTWTKRITGKHRAVFDVPEIESGHGVLPPPSGVFATVLAPQSGRAYVRAS
ncbi:MAG: hypothetical protein ACXW61_11205 [Gemmatirosa sp.]